MTPASILRRCVAILAGAAALAGPARADYSTTFSVPPFRLNASALGIEGWESRIPGTPDDGLAARVVAIRWNGNNPALVLQRAAIRNAFPKPEGNRVQVTVKIAVTFPRVGANLQQARIAILNAPFGEIVFDASKTGGLGFGDGTGRKGTIAVPIDEMKPNAFYTYSIVIDYDLRTYDATITGVKRDGTPLLYENKGVAFEPKQPALNSVLIITGSVIRTYLGEFSIKSL
ncbi:MAG TPA: hypothetical protein PLS03_15955 [Terrimicrobiaceae bacterium]|nr:hypothetical protein [Terrimicrobiaceae bacterium]